MRSRRSGGGLPVFLRVLIDATFAVHRCEADRVPQDAVVGQRQVRLGAVTREKNAS